MVLPVYGLLVTLSLMLLAAWGGSMEAHARVLVAQNFASGKILTVDYEIPRLDRPQRLEHSIGTAACDEFASGRPKWPARDPIGERGGKNLYGMIRNDTINHVDGLGLTGVGELRKMESEDPVMINDAPPIEPLIRNYQATTDCRLAHRIECSPCNGSTYCKKISGDVWVNPLTKIYMRERTGGGHSGTFLISVELLKILIRHEEVHVRKCRDLAEYWNKTLESNSTCSTNCEEIKAALVDSIHESKPLPASHDDPADWQGGISYDEFNEALSHERVNEQRRRQQTK